MTSYNKVAPASGPSDLPWEDRRSTNGVRQVAVKLFGSTTSQDGQGGTGFRTEAHLEDSPGLPSMSSSGDQEEIAEVQRLSSLPEFLTANAKDPGFTLLHYVALLGNTTLAAALRHAQPDVQRRYASMARYLVRSGSEYITTDQYGCIPLQLAASIGNRDMVEALLEPFEGQAVHMQRVKRSDYVNYQDNQIRFTALHGALNHAQHEVAILLLQRGANPQLLDITRNNALQVAPSLESLQELLRLVVQHEDAVPTPAIAQLMIEVIKQQEARDKAEAARAKAAAAAAAAEAARGDDNSSKAKLECSKASKMAPNLDPAELAGKTSGPPGGGVAADAAKGGAHGEAGGEVGDIVKRLFKKLYAKIMHDDIWEYVRAAIDNNNYKLTQMMLDFVCDDCPRALAVCNWEATLGPLIACFPDLFFSLLRKLQHGGRAEDAMGFARSLPGLRTTASSTQQQAMILIYEQLGEGLHEAGYAVNRAFWEHTDEAVLCDMAQFPAFKRFVGAMSRCVAAPTGDGSSSSGLAMDTDRQTISDLLAPSGKHKHAPVQGMEDPPGGEGSSGGGSSDSRSNSRVLGVGRVLAATLASRVDHVDAVVEAIVTWVEFNAVSGLQVFIGGITKDLLCRLVESAPAPAIRLLSLVGPSAWDRLKIMQVPSGLLRGGNHLVMSTHMRNSCVWRSPELAHLADMGYSEVAVDTLIDFGVPFECIYKAATDLATRPECFAVLVGTGLTGTDMKLLISNSISLTRVAEFINACSGPLLVPLGYELRWRPRVAPAVSLLQDMLRQRLSFRIVEAILDSGEMNEATLYANFMPGYLTFFTYPLPLYKPVYTAHFVQLLLTNWRMGARDMAGNVTLQPWDKRFIDTLFAANDPLSLALKSAYDNKLKDTAVYLPPQANEAGSQFEQQRKLLLGGFVGNPLLLHRWPIFLLARLGLAAYEAGKALLQRAHRLRNGAAVPSPKSAQGSSAVDAFSLALPWWAAADVGEGNVLSALVSADAPSSFFGLVLVRSVFKLQWDVLGKPLILLSAAVHLQLAACWLTFYLLVLDARQSQQGEDGQPLLLRDGPTIMLAMLYVSVALSSSMALELVMELRRGRMGLRWNWVTFGRWVELCSHALVWSCAGLVRQGGPQQADTVAALAGLATLLFALRMLLFALATERLCQVVLALLEIVSESRYFFSMLGIVYGAFALALAGLRSPHSDGGSGSSALALATKLFTMIAGDVSSDDLRDGSDSGLSWTFTGLAATLLALYAVAMLIVFINLLIATMNDTYDRVKEFQEVEVMRLRSHMLEGLRLHVSRNALAAFQGNCVHVLLRHGNTAAQWLARSSGSDIADQEAWTAWTGRIRYMRETIVRGVDERLQPVLARVQAAAAGSGDRAGLAGPPPTHKEVR